MKKFFSIAIASLVFILFTGIPSRSFPQVALTPDSVTMTPGYALEVYYNMTGGEVSSAIRNNWDIAFRTAKISSSILTNDGSGVILYTYPKADTSGWASVDTAGLSTWTPMYNDPYDWENGAFSRNALGHPDYGWGIYNMSTHNLAGDSLFVIKLTDGSFKKLWIVSKHSAAATFVFRFANLDGTGESEITLDCTPYSTKDFLGYSLVTNEAIDYQPAKDTWDILFTKYMSVQPNGDPYPVTGVLSNPEVKTKLFRPVDLSYGDWTVNPWDSTRSGIGWDWKQLNFSTLTYEIVDSTVYFVQDQLGDIHKLIFTRFAGGSTGDIVFEKAKVSSIGINEPDAATILIYPDPATSYVNVNAGNDIRNGIVTLTDLSGRVLRTLDYAGSATQMSLEGMQPGIYMVSLVNGSDRIVRKLIITR